MKKYKVIFLTKTGRIVAIGRGYANSKEEAEINASFAILFRNIEYDLTQVWEDWED